MRYIKHLRQSFATFPNTFEVRQKYFAKCHIPSPLLAVWKCGQTHSFMFDTFDAGTHSPKWRDWLCMS